MKNKKYLSLIIAISIFVVILLLDLLTKEFIIKGLIPSVGDSVDVIPKFINFVYVKNTGAAWGMLAGRPVFLIVVSILVLGLLIAFYILRIRKTNKYSSVWLAVSMGLIVGGCIGNLIDRMVFGYVRDFINFQFFDFPVFNFADVALTFGMIFILVYFIFFYAKEDYLLKKEEKTKQNKENLNESLEIIKEIKNSLEENLESSDKPDEDKGGYDEG